MLGETVRERYRRNWPGVGNLASQRPQTVAERKGELPQGLNRARPGPRRAAASPRVCVVVHIFNPRALEARGSQTSEVSLVHVVCFRAT